MEFTFNVNDVLAYSITKIEHNFIPPGFTGDRRKLWDLQSKLTDIVNVMGEASARAQGLNKPITTADRLKNSEHTLYLLTDPKGSKGKGAVLGLLKVGRKGLYIFDREGQHHQLKPLCVLDFYVHENMQRMGLGKKIFEYMLQEEEIEPIRLAIDRPSEKFLGFLKKHYGLTGPIPQMNNFVVFDGFFHKHQSGDPSNKIVQRAVENNNSNPSNISPTNTQNGYHGSHFGRYGAPRPPCSMGQIIHNRSPTVQPTEPNSESPPQQLVHQSPKLERPRSLSLHTCDDADIKINDEKFKIDDAIEEKETFIPNLDVNVENLSLTDKIISDTNEDGASSHVTKVMISERENNIIPSDIPVQYTPRTPSNLTEQGFLDLKFYHSRLW